MATKQMEQKSTEVQPGNGLVKKASDRLMKMIESGELHLPENYSAENALKSAWLALQEVQDKNKRPALQVCTPGSISNALLDMVIQGLNPAKDQCYFVVFGSRVVLMRSYMGAMALIQRIHPGSVIHTVTVYEGDEVEFEISGGERRVSRHKQALKNVNSGKVVGAYCIVTGLPWGETHTYMTIDQLKRAWQQGSGFREGQGVHSAFADQMAEKTVINRACKRIIGQSDDKYLVLAARRSSVDATEAEVAAQAEEEANSIPLDISDYREVTEDTEEDTGEQGSEPVPVPEPNPEPEKREVPF